MAATTNENTVETELPSGNAGTEEFHDAETVHTGEIATLTGAEWKEMYLLIKMTYNDRSEAKSSPQKHMNILKAMGNAFDNTELELYDNRNRKLSLEACCGMMNLQHYESHFTIHQGNG